VRLVDDDQPGFAGEQWQHVGGELRVVEPLGGDQQQVDLIGGDLRLQLPPLADVGGVDADRADPDLAGGGDLVPHQGQQRRDQERRPGPGVAQEPGGQEVHRRLAPAGPLDDQHPPAVGGDGGDGRELIGAGDGVRAGQLAQQLGDPLGDGRSVEEDGHLGSWSCGPGEEFGPATDSLPHPWDTPGRSSTPVGAGLTRAGLPCTCACYVSAAEVQD
jgi:hypothetical protein